MAPSSAKAFLFALFALALGGCATTGSSGGAATSELAGTVTYLPRIALPPDAAVVVRLLDVSRADAPAETLAEETISTEGVSVPVPFTLRYDADRVDARHRYVVRAEIRDALGDLTWTTDTAVPVLTNGAPSSGVEVRVVQVTSEPEGESGGGADVLRGPEWRLVELRAAGGAPTPPEGDGAFTVSFLEDGRFLGQADCNQYGGTYRTEPGGDLVLSDAATTLAACAPPSSSRDFFGTLGQVVGYSVAGDRLTLRAADGRALVFRAGAAPDLGGMPPQETGRDYAYTCASDDGPFTFRIRTGPGEVALWLPPRFEGREGGTYRVLGQVVSASGAKYQDGPVTVWTKGEDYALLDVDGQEFLDCPADPARAGRLLLRGTGDGWYLEVVEAGDGARLRLVGAFEERGGAATVTRSGAQTVYRADGLVVTATDEPCTDADSGDTTGTRVTVELDGRTHEGCGQRTG
ncbi:YbaY family lipoprotein [Rubrivirga litoralis]|uniref:YbaY family lipoprotein n=1 Tax=Rubrivirga litoralis TaxID=3075598 RepID=A0ABU3BNN9_9BACT|nr:YbaY family lipoprotein [Rubrivirga sp. F394]MDT0630831.1 YbaY family lipoprotein [Rubrivirga sp. F394]